MNWFLRRKSVLIDPQFQLAYLKIGLLTGLMVAMIAGGVVLIMLTAGGLDDRVRALFVQLAVGMVAFVLIFSMLLGLFNMVMTHRVAGAARKIHGYILDLTSGKYDAHVKLRDSDYLQQLAKALNDLADTLRDRHADFTALAVRLESLRDRLATDGQLTQENRATLDDLVSRLRGPQGQPQTTGSKAP